MTATGRLAPLRISAFRRYLAGQLLSVSGSWVQVVALTCLVVERDRQALGLVVTLQFLPMLLAPVFGAVADRRDRRQIVMAAEAGLGAVALVYAALALSGRITIGWIAVVAALWGVINALDTPARQAFLADLVPVAAIPQTGPLYGLVLLSGMTVGAATGAVLYARAGLAVCCFVNAVSFLIDVAILRTLRVHPQPTSTTAPGRRAVQDGLRYVRTTPVLRAALGAFAVASTLTFTFPVSVPLLAASFETSAVGTFMAATAAGSLAGMVVAAVRRRGGALGIGRCAVGLAAATGAVAIAPGPLGAMAAVFAMGAAWSLFLTAVIVTLYASTERPMMGRVMALFGLLLVGSTPLGSQLVAALAEAAGSRAPFVLGALAALAAAALARVPDQRAPSPSRSDTVPGMLSGGSGIRRVPLRSNPSGDGPFRPHGRAPDVRLPSASDRGLLALLQPPTDLGAQTDTRQAPSATWEPRGTVP